MAPRPKPPLDALFGGAFPSIDYQGPGVCLGGTKWTETTPGQWRHTGGLLLGNIHHPITE